MLSREAVRSGVWLYLSVPVSSLFGFFYWFLMARLVGAEALGYAAAVASLATVVFYIISLDVSNGVLRYVGEALGRGDVRSASRYVWSGVWHVLYVGSAAAVLAYFTSLSLGLTRSMALAAALLVVTNVSVIAEAYIIAAFRAVVKFLAVVVSNAVRFAVGVSLAGWGWAGAVAGNVAWSVVNALFLLWYVYKSVGFSHISWREWVEIAKVGISTWSPRVLAVAAQQSGVLAVFYTSGAVGGGHLFIAYGIAGVVGALSTVVFGVLTPALSAMEEHRRDVTLATSRIALALAAPAAVGLAIAPYVPLSVLGPDFRDAALPLSLLALAVIFGVFNNAVLSFLLAEKRYLHALILSSVSTGVMLSLYVFLIPTWGAVGAAFSNLIASAAAFLTASIFLKPTGRHFIAISLPLAVGALAFWLPWPLMIVGGVYLLYPRLGVLTRREIAFMAEALLGKRAHAVYERYRSIINMLIPT